MSVDASQLQSPAVVSASVTQGSVAPPPVTQALQPTPGATQPVPGSQPAAPQTDAAPQVPAENWQEQLRQTEARRLQAEQEAAQLRGVVQQVQTFAQQQEEERQFNERMNIALAAADGMPADQAKQYIIQQTKAIRDSVRQQMQQQFGQREQQFQQALRQISLPSYADHLAESMGLTPDAKAELLALGDADMMYRMAPAIKQRYDAFNSQLAALQGNQVQQARAQEVSAMQQAGLGAVGGQNVGGSFQVDIPDHLSADDKAMLIYNYQKYGPGYQPPQR